MTNPEGKRPKLERDTSGSTRSSSHDQHERAVNRRLSSAQPEFSAAGNPTSNPSPTTSSARLPAASSHPLKPTSPDTRPLSSLNSPCTSDHFSPVSASPRSAALQREPLSNFGRDLRGPINSIASYHSVAYNTDSHYQSASTTPPAYAYGSHYQNPGDHSSRRSIRESTQLPPLNHEDTTLSSESGQSGRSLSMVQLPGPTQPLESAKPFRMLPQPMPSIGPSSSPLDRPPPLPPTAPAPQLQHQLHDYRSQGPLAILIRAGEMAANAAGHGTGQSSSP